MILNSPKPFAYLFAHTTYVLVVIIIYLSLRLVLCAEVKENGLYLIKMDYQNGKIYKIWSPSTDKVYIGSTCSTLVKRLYGHRKNKKCYDNNSIACKYTSFEILEYPDARIELVEDFPCNSKAELTAREGYWIRQENSVNKVIPTRSRTEWYQDNRENKLEYAKEYREEHKDKIREYLKQYHNKNKEKIRARQNEKVQCECGTWIARNYLGTHRKSEKHQRLTGH